jgi:hypothetical protein
LDNPLTNAAMVFIEPFPVGLIITLISSAILRKKRTRKLRTSEEKITATGTSVLKVLVD